MTKAEFKKIYSEYRSIRYWLHKQFNTGMPCGHADYLAEQAYEAEMKMQNKYPTLAYVNGAEDAMENRLGAYGWHVASIKANIRWNLQQLSNIKGMQ